jgi:alanine racemase
VYFELKITIRKMKLNLTSNEFASAIQSLATINFQEDIINSVVYDTRLIVYAQKQVFFALKGNQRDGHDYIDEAISKGIKHIVVGKNYIPTNELITFYQVDDCLHALQKLAIYHRNKFNIPVIAITGSVGKTTVKEWLYFLLNDHFSIVRSPKSYNSQLGVALSLLEIKPENNIAIIEAGISQKGEMDVLKKMIQPTLGVFTAFSTAHRTGFRDDKEHFIEKMKLFSDCIKVWYPKNISQIQGDEKFIALDNELFHELLEKSPFQTEIDLQNLCICLAVCIHFQIDPIQLSEKIKQLPRLALRMESFEGHNGNTIINDTYNLDLDSLRFALEYQLKISNNAKRVLILSKEGFTDELKEQVDETIKLFQLDEIIIWDKNNPVDSSRFSNTIILIKGSRTAKLEQIVNQFRLKKHKTTIEINLSAVRQNLDFLKSKLASNTKVLAMIKASSYGSGAEKMAVFLEQNRVDYLGVAYTDEGVELRKKGVKLPILVMNVEEDSFEDVINFSLEPAIYSFEVLEEFTKMLIYKGLKNHPIHLKFNTGMNRLGFGKSDIYKIIDILQAQPELLVQGVFSHLADADNYENCDFTLQQIEQFSCILKKLKDYIHNPIIAHLCNTEASFRFPQAHFDMVRMGIGLYGISSNPGIQLDLTPAIRWKSVITQIQVVKQGESVGYNRKFKAEKDTKIAIIPVGYADGFKRSLSNGNGKVFIQGTPCFVVGNVCMDMTFVDIQNLNCKPGDEVEIIGTHQTVIDLAKSMETIPYEVLTSLSKRVVRTYSEE